MQRRYRMGKTLKYILLTVLEILILRKIRYTALWYSHPLIVIIIAIALNLIIFKHYFSSKSFNNRSQNSLNNATSPPPQSNSLQIENNSLIIVDLDNFGSSNLSKAKFENGKVYGTYNSNSALIGSYTLENDNVLVFSNNAREIGRLPLENGVPSMIFLSNLGWYNYMAQSRPGFQPDYNKKDVTYYAAEIYPCGTIEDKETRKIIAEYRGDAIGAAAAFICLQYEYSTIGKYYNFFHG